MKSLFILLVALTVTLPSFAQKANTPKTKPTAIQVQYSCPMHPEVVSDKPGKCSKCNMDLTLSKKEQMKAEVTKTYTCPIHKEFVSDHAGTCPKCKKQLVVDRRGSKQAATVYSCSMHPDVASDKPGKCPVCNMNLQVSNKNNNVKKG